jgi:hypothetical protein
MRVMQAVFGHKQLMWAMAVIVVQDDIKDRVVGASMNVVLDEAEGGDDDKDEGLLREVGKIARDRWDMIDDAKRDE